MAAALVAAGCAPKNVPALKDPIALQAFCGQQYVPRLTAIENIATSLRDGDPHPSTQTVKQMLAAEKASTGLMATWNQAELYLPKDARAFGEPDDYIRIRRIAIVNVPEGTDPPRPVDLEVLDHGTYRWYRFAAYDTQNVCVEGQHLM